MTAPFWVADRGRHIVKQFAADGKYPAVHWRRTRQPGPARCGIPAALATDGKEKLYVAERGTNRVQVFSLTK